MSHEKNTFQAANYKKGIDATDGCDRITCDKSATLTVRGPIDPN